MDRRLLAIGALAVLALLSGCSAPGSIDLTAVNTTELADRVSTSPESLAPFPERSNQSPRSIVQAAVVNDSVTVRGPDPPLDSSRPFKVAGGYYAITHTVINEGEATAVTVEVDYDTNDSATPVIAFEDLPAVDQAVLDDLLPQRAPDGDPGADIAVGAFYTAAELEQSILAPQSDYAAVKFRGGVYPIEIGEPRTVSIFTYRYTATQIADSPQAFGNHIRETYGFELEDVTEGERSILSEAIDSGQYRAESTDDAAFERLLDRFRDHRSIEEDQVSGTWVVYYRGSWYVAELRWSGFLGG